MLMVRVGAHRLAPPHDRRKHEGGVLGGTYAAGAAHGNLRVPCGMKYTKFHIVYYPGENK